MRRGLVAALGGLICGLMCATFAGLAQAQVTAALDSSAALECLTPAPALRGDAEYPAHALKDRRSGTVAVELEFSQPDRAPAVKVLSSQGGGEFVDSVRQHVATFRVPCQHALQPSVRLQLSFHFEPDKRRVHWSDPEDVTEAERRHLLKCVAHAAGKAHPAYPLSALQRELVGVVLARAEFTAPDRAPQVQVFSRPGTQALAESAREWLAQLRMPCHTGTPLAVRYQFRFRMEDSPPYGFKPGMKFMELLPVIKGIDQQTLRFDTSQMGCPFELRFAYRQPDLPNLVGEVGNADPRRRPLLQWLRQSELALPSRALNAVYGDFVQFTVPCLDINLTPKEKSS